MNTYRTSSKVVQDYIKRYGQPDVIKVHKLFTDGRSANRFEMKFLRRVKARKSERWLNINDGIPQTSEYTQERRDRISKSCVKRPPIKESTRLKLKLARNSRPHPRGWTRSEDSKVRTPKTIISCPSCKCSGGLPAMKRWHFDNCKALTNA